MEAYSRRVANEGARADLADSPHTLASCTDSPRGYALTPAPSRDRTLKLCAALGAESLQDHPPIPELIP